MLLETRLEAIRKRSVARGLVWGCCRLYISGAFLALVELDSTGADSSTLAPIELRCEYLSDPIAIETAHPRLSWILQTTDETARGQRQIAYQILVANNRSKLEASEGNLWDSGRLHSSQSIHVPYAGATLVSGEDCFWKVRTWDEQSKASGWSKPAHWRMGLLKPADWHAKWIGLDEAQNKSSKPALQGAQWIWFPEGKPEVSAPIAARYFRRSFDIDPHRVVRTATCLLAADSKSEVFINGKHAGAANSHRMAAQFEVTSLVRAGTNLIAASAENVDWEDDPNPAGFIAWLRVEFERGEPLLIATAGDWKSSNVEIAGWKDMEFDETGWVSARQLGAAGTGPWGEISTPGERRLAARMLRREFVMQGKIARATARVCGLGLFEFYLNGKKVGTDVLSPPLTDYSKRVCYITFDVTKELRAGTNAAGIMLGNGRFYAPRSRVPTETVSYGFPKLLFQMQVDYDNGGSEEIISDEHWRLSTEGPIRANNEYDGEEYDARMELDGWCEIGFDDSKWQQAELADPPGGVLSAQSAEPIRVTQTLKPRDISEPKPGVYVFDFGQNFAGWCRLKVTGPRGTWVSLRHAEALSPDGLADTRNARSAEATDTYILKGNGTEFYEPRFTCHGFRYVEVRGYPGQPDASSLVGLVVHDDLESAGEFECSNGLLNRIYKSVRWTLRSNYRSIPVDCAERDERQGWLGDRGAESRGETYIFNTAAFYSKWLLDMEDAQKENGSMPDICPPYWPICPEDVVWPSTTVLVPGMLHDQYGDIGIIESHYASMARWLQYMTRFVTNGIISRDSYGDWGVPPEDPKLIHSRDPNRKTIKPLLATAYWYHDVRLMARYATWLGRHADAAMYAKQAAIVKRAFNRRFFNKRDGQYDNGSQTSCVLPLAFGLVPSNEHQRMFDWLVNKISRDSEQHIGTGIIGGQWLLRVLSDNGRPDVAYAIVNQTSYPSLGYMLDKGATTIWELWNGDTAELWDPDVAEAGMSSANHSMHIGDLVTWLYEYLAGIKVDADQPGFKHIVMRCEPVRGVSFVRATHRSPYGLIRSEWKKKTSTGAFRWIISIPVNTTATVYLPASRMKSVNEGDKPAVQSKSIKLLKMENGRAVFVIGSGNYCFESATE